MRNRVRELIVAMVIVLAGAGIVAAWIPLSTSDEKIETASASDVVETSPTTTIARGPSLPEFAAVVELDAFYDGLLLLDFAHAYQSHLDAVAASRAQQSRPPAPPPIPRQYVDEPASVPSGSVWDRIAQCESGGNWAINTGNGYSGGLQFANASWRGFGGTDFAPMAYQASREQQIVVAERILASSGWGAWPACSSRLGLR